MKLWSREWRKISFIILGGEVTVSNTERIDYEKIAREAAAEIGYIDHSVGMNAKDRENCHVKVLISQQSTDIARSGRRKRPTHRTGLVTKA